jgi:general secretion pathway protein E
MSAATPIQIVVPGEIQIRDFFGQILIKHGLVTADKLAPLYEAVKERGQSLVELLVAGNLTDEARIAQALADEAGVALMQKIDIDAIAI